MTRSTLPARRLRVMVIDDDELACAAMSRLLRLAGFEVHALASPLGASKEISRLRIQVVVVDINMPAMRGERLVALFRGTPRLRNLPVVLISGEEAEDLERLAEAVDADATLPKADMKRLAEVVLEASQRKRS